MNFEEYCRESERTMIDMGKEKNLLHASFGLITELGELVDIYKRNTFYGKDIDLVNVKEELGDIFWYLAIIYRIYPNALQYKERIVNRHSNEKFIFEIQDHINSLCYFLRYSKEEDIEIMLVRLFGELKSFSEFNNFIFEDVLQTNINKLKARFPEKFTNELALNRDLDKERKVLENTKNVVNLK